MPSKVHGAMPCPREYGHRGAHYWWVPFELGGWRVVVYSGEAPERKRICRGGFTSMPHGTDVHQLLVTVGTLRRREQARRIRA